MPVNASKMMVRLNAKMPKGSGLLLPPPCFLDMDGEFIEYEDGQWLSARFPVKQRYQNPLGYMQGGFILAALDNTLGPFSYLIAPPSVTSQLNTSYLRPVSRDDKEIMCTARLTERTKKQLFISCDARNGEDKVVAVTHAICHIL